MRPRAAYLAMFRVLNMAPGMAANIVFSGTRESEQPIHRICPDTQHISVSEPTGKENKGVE